MSLALTSSRNSVKQAEKKAGTIARGSAEPAHVKSSPIEEHARG
jgi:hypothetical protein